MPGLLFWPPGEMRLRQQERKQHSMAVPVAFGRCDSRDREQKWKRRNARRCQKKSARLSPEELAAESGVPRIRIVLDPGHGGPGTTDEQELGAKYRDTFEKYLTLKIAQAAGQELSTYGNVEVLYTRETDKALTLKERAAYAKAVDARLPDQFSS